MANRWLKQYTLFIQLEKSLSGNTVSSYLFDLQRLSEYVGEVDVADLKAEILEAFFAMLHDLGLHARSRARMLSSLKSFYGFLLERAYIQENPCDRLDAPELGFHLPEVLSLEEIDRMLRVEPIGAYALSRNRALLETLYSCGLRVSELVGLTWSHCSFAEGYIHVEGKGGKQRLVPISDAVIQRMNDWMVERNELNIKPGHEDFVFLGRNGRALSRSMVFRIVRLFAEEAGIERVISPHTFRHSFATHLLEGGANLRVIQQMLGHESIQTTEIYTHMDKTYLREQIQLFHPRNQSNNRRMT